MKQIQWFPGHMVKALREMQNQIDSVDIVIEILDARIPFSSQNPEIALLVKKKPVLVVFSKKDLADDKTTDKWVKYYEDKGFIAYPYDVSKLDVKIIKNKCKDVLKEKILKDKEKGLRERPIRAMIVGIPNVGKSTFINKVANRKAAKVENRPGVTKSNQYIKIKDDFILLDTPGVLWPNFDDKKVGLNLALIGSIKQTILPNDTLEFELVKLLTHKYPGLLSKHYNIIEEIVNDETENLKFLENLGTKRGFLLQNNSIDFERCIVHLLREFANGKLGKISLEDPNDGR